MNAWTYHVSGLFSIIFSLCPSKSQECQWRHSIHTTGLQPFWMRTASFNIGIILRYFSFKSALCPIMRNWFSYRMRYVQLMVLPDEKAPSTSSASSFQTLVAFFSKLSKWHLAQSGSKATTCSEMIACSQQETPVLTFFTHVSESNYLNYIMRNSCFSKCIPTDNEIKKFDLKKKCKKCNR